MAGDYICHLGKTDRKHSQSSDFNAVSFTDYKHYHTNERSYHEIHRISSWLSREDEMSASVFKRDAGKSYINKTIRKLETVFGQHKAPKDKGKLL